MTYKELKIFSMQKMFHDITDLTVNSVTKPYLDKMPYVAGCALMRVATLGFVKKKTFEIVKMGLKNELINCDKTASLHTVVSEDVVFEAGLGKAYYFEVSGKGKAQILVGNKIAKSFVFDTDKLFESLKGKFENENNLPVKLVFSAGEPYIVRNCAIYDGNFENDEDVCENSEYSKYDMNNLTSDFYCFDTSSFVDEKCEKGVNNFRFSENGIVEIKNNISGSWTIPYLAYPNVINSQTNDDEVIDLPYELCMLLPFYIASELYLEEDSGLAVGWRNKFETSLAEYASQRNQKVPKKAQVVCFGGTKYGEI